MTTSRTKLRTDVVQLIRCVMLLVITTILLVVILGSMIYLYVIITTPNPKACFPEFHVITSASDSNTNSTTTWDIKFLVNTSASDSNTNSTTTWNFKFLVDNPNKDILLIYEDFKGSLYHGYSLLIDITMPNFYQGEMKQTTVEAMVPGDKNSSHASRVVQVEGIHREMPKLNLWMLGKIGFKLSKLETRWIWSRIVCENLVFQLYATNISGTSLGGTYDCYVEKFVI